MSRKKRGGQDDLDDDGDKNDNKDQRSKLASYSKMLGMLNKNSFHSWDENLGYLEYHTSWPKEILDRDRNHVDNRWDGNEEDDNGFAVARRDAFALLHMHVEPELQHLFLHARPGDAKGADSIASASSLMELKILSTK